MDTSTDYLKRIAEEIAALPQPPAANKIPNHHLENEANRLEKAIIHSLYQIENDTQRDTFHFNTLRKLVTICDILFAHTTRVDANVQILLDLLTNIKAILPTEIRPNTRLPKAFVLNQGQKFQDAWNNYMLEMRKQGISEELIELAAIPFKRFKLDKHPLFWGDFTWLKGYQAKLDIMDWEHADCSSKSEALISLLIGRDFNDDRFYIYCKKYIEARVKMIKGKRDRVLELAQCENLVREDTQEGTAAFDAHANSVSTRLIKLIREKIDFIETHEREHPYAKLSFNLYKYTVAFFFKLLHEQKVFGDITFRELSEQIASTCTAMGADIPPGSITKKAYPYKQVDFQRMEALLLAMLEYLRRFM